MGSRYLNGMNLLRIQIETTILLHIFIQIAAHDELGLCYPDYKISASSWLAQGAFAVLPKVWT